MQKVTHLRGKGHRQINPGIGNISMISQVYDQIFNTREIMIVKYQMTLTLPSGLTPIVCDDIVHT